ncbi:hypothetical protein D3C80_1614710 [compost metagenome]
MFWLATSSASNDRSASTTSASGNTSALTIPMQPEPVHRSRMRAGSLASHGSKRFSISSPMGERGISTRSSTIKARPQNHASPNR